MLEKFSNTCFTASSQEGFVWGSLKVEENSRVIWLVLSGDKAV